MRFCDRLSVLQVVFATQIFVASGPPTFLHLLQLVNRELKQQQWRWHRECQANEQKQSLCICVIKTFWHISLIAVLCKITMTHDQSQAFVDYVNNQW